MLTETTMPKWLTVLSETSGVCTCKCSIVAVLLSLRIIWMAQDCKPKVVLFLKQAQKHDHSSASLSRYTTTITIMVCHHQLQFMMRFWVAFILFCNPLYWGVGGLSSVILSSADYSEHSCVTLSPSSMHSLCGLLVEWQIKLSNTLLVYSFWNGYILVRFQIPTWNIHFNLAGIYDKPLLTP